MSCGGCAGGKS